jgi:fatty acid amide hydrolase
MVMTADLWKLGARQLATRIRNGDVTALDATEAHIARIEQVNPQLNAVVVKRFDDAREEARALDVRRAAGAALGALHGVPVTIKESLDFGGLPSTFGVTAHRHDFPGKDDVYVARFREAGAVVLGKTNVAQMLLFVETDNPVYGRTQNPWDVTRSPGGSSGGEAAIIAAMGSPLGLGSDIGGSCRNPAAACGVVGFKPTAGRTPDASRGSFSVGQLAIESQVGTLARSVEDVALGLEVANGGRHPVSEEQRPLGDASTVDLSNLTVGYFVDDGVLAPCAAAARAVREARDALEARGAKLVPFEPPEILTALGLFHQILASDGGQGLARFLDGSPRDIRIARMLAIASAPGAALRVLLPLMRVTGRRKLAEMFHSYGRRDTASHWDAVIALKDYRMRFATALDRTAAPIDALLSPAMALPAVRHGAVAELGVVGAYSSLYNVLGYPAGVVPFTRVRLEEETGTPRSSDKMDRAAHETEKGSAGLPIGIQIAARPFREHVALALMSAVERAALERPDRPSAEKLPPPFRVQEPGGNQLFKSTTS